MPRSRTLSPSEKKDVASAALTIFRKQNPGCEVRITVENETDADGVPRYTVTVTPRGGASS